MYYDHCSNKSIPYSNNIKMSNLGGVNELSLALILIKGECIKPIYKANNSENITSKFK